MRNATKIFNLGLFHLILMLSVLSAILPINDQLHQEEGRENQEERNFILNNKIETLPKVLRIGEKFRPIDYDPLNPGSMAAFKKKSLMYESLLEFDPVTNELIPALATQWTVTTDSKDWIFDLREDITFHDGTKFNASSVKYNFDRMIDSSLPEYYPVESIPLQSIEIINEYRVKISLTEPYAPLGNLMPSLIKILSSNSFDETGHLITPIGTGPYMLEVSTSDEYFQNFTRFMNYHKGLPPFEQIHYYNFGDTPPNLWENYETNITNHDLDFVSSLMLKDMQVDTLEQTLDDEYWIVTVLEEITIQGKLYVNHDVPNLSDNNVRKALNYAINKSVLIEESYRDTAIPMQNLLPLGVPFANENVPGYPYNVTKANELLDEGGYSKRTDGYRFDLELMGTTISVATLEIIAADFEEIGVRSTVVLPPDYWDKLTQGDFELFILGTGVLFDPDSLWEYLHPDSPYNYGKFSNETITEILMAGRQTPIKQEREYYYNELQWLIQDASPYIYLTDGNTFYAASTAVNDYVFMNKLSEIDFTFLEPIPKGLVLLRANGLEEKNNVYQTKDVEITEKPTYLPMTDAVLSTRNQEKVITTLKMTHQLKELIPNQELSGKFYELIPTILDKDLIFRAYFDQWEVNNLPLELLTLHLWDSKTLSWIELTSVITNTTFRFLETNLTGYSIIKIEVSSTKTQTTPFDVVSIVLVIFVFSSRKQRKKPE